MILLVVDAQKQITNTDLYKFEGELLWIQLLQR